MSSKSNVNRASQESLSAPASQQGGKKNVKKVVLCAAVLVTVAAVSGFVGAKFSRSRADGAAARAKEEEAYFAKLAKNAFKKDDSVSEEDAKLWEAVNDMARVYETVEEFGFGSDPFQKESQLRTGSAYRRPRLAGSAYRRPDPESSLDDLEGVSSLFQDAEAAKEAADEAAKKVAVEAAKRAADEEAKKEAEKTKKTSESTDKKAKN